MTRARVFVVGSRGAFEGRERTLRVFGCRICGDKRKSKSGLERHLLRQHGYQKIEGRKGP